MKKKKLYVHRMMLFVYDVGNKISLHCTFQFRKHLPILLSLWIFRTFLGGKHCYPFFRGVSYKLRKLKLCNQELGKWRLAQSFRILQSFHSGLERSMYVTWGKRSRGWEVWVHLGWGCLHRLMWTLGSGFALWISWILNLSAPYCYLRTLDKKLSYSEPWFLHL